MGEREETEASEIRTDSLRQRIKERKEKGTSLDGAVAQWRQHDRDVDEFLSGITGWVRSHLPQRGHASAPPRAAELDDEADDDLSSALSQVEEAKRTWKSLTIDHLTDFVGRRPRATFEQWVTDLHPENSYKAPAMKLPRGAIDHRFYVDGADHMVWWNDTCTTRQRRGLRVAPRYFEQKNDGE